MMSDCKLKEAQTANKIRDKVLQETAQCKKRHNRSKGYGKILVDAKLPPPLTRTPGNDDGKSPTAKNSRTVHKE